MGEEQKAKRTTRRARDEGSVYRQEGSRFWWISWRSGGKRHAKSTKTESVTEARKMLNQILADIGRGVVVTPKINKISVVEALKAVIDNQRLRGKRSADDNAQRIAAHLVRSPEHPDAFFEPERPLITLTTAALEQYQEHRINTEKAAVATVNRELALVKAAFRLAMRRGHIVQMPYVPILPEHNVRENVVEPEQFDRLLAELPEWLRPAFELAYAAGWRRSEVFSLKAADVNRTFWTVRVSGRVTKTGQQKEQPVPPFVVELLEKQFASLDALKEQGIDLSWVFHRPDGSEITKDTVRHYWERARKNAGYPTTRIHDLRRSAVRNFERAGVPRGTAMTFTGHVTEATYRRYNIQDEARQREAIERMQVWAEEHRGKAKAKPAKVRQFRRKSA